MVCGSMGYNKFLSPERLKKIMRWQKKSGCYGDLDDEKAGPYLGESTRDDMEPLGLGRSIRNMNAHGKNGVKDENIHDRSQGNDDRLVGTAR